VATESVLPWLLNKWESKTMRDEKKSSSAAKEKSQKKVSQGSEKAKGGLDTIVSIEDEFVLDEYEAFDDYLEMVRSSPYLLSSH
jgi:hypothetical protein